METVAAFFWNTEQHRLRTFWRLLLFTIAYFVALVILGIVLGIVAFGAATAAGLDMPGGGGQSLEQMPLEVRTIVLGLNMATGLLATFLVMWLAGRFLDRRRFADFGLHLSGGWWLDLGFGMALGALLMGGVFLVEWAAGWLTITTTFQSPEELSFWPAILLPLLAFLAVGIYEEMLTRGYLLQNLAEGFNFRALGGARGAIVLAWVLSSAVFGLLHAGNPNATAISTTNLMLAGIFLGLGYVLTGELAIPIGLHITWNFFQGNVFGFPVSGGNFYPATFIAIEQGGPDTWTGGSFGPEAGLIGIAAMLVGSALTLLWVRLRRGSLALHLPLAEAPHVASDRPSPQQAAQQRELAPDTPQS
jgi:hypothetical protein